MAHKNGQELSALTSLRGIAAILVMFHHFMFVVLLDIGKVVPSKLFLKSYLWVDLFFILSGFVLAYVYHSVFCTGVSGNNYRHFMQTRFARIYPLHLFVLLLFVAFESMQWLSHSLGLEGAKHLAPPFSGETSLEPLVTNLFLVQTLHWKAYWNQPAWSISAEWIIYFALPFLMRWLIPVAHRRPAVLAFITLTPLVLIEWYFGDLGLYYAGWPMLVRCLSEATLGVLAFRCYQTGLFSQLASGKLVTHALILNLVLLSLPGPGVISVAGFVWLVLCASRLPNDRPHFLNSPVLLYLGKISYSVYLVHWLILDIVRDTVNYFEGESVSEFLSLPTQLSAMIVMMVVVIGISHLTYHLIEAPMRKRLKPD